MNPPNKYSIVSSKGELFDQCRTLFVARQIEKKWKDINLGDAEITMTWQFEEQYNVKTKKMPSGVFKIIKQKTSD